MSNEIRGWAALDAQQPLELYTYHAGPLGPEEVEIAVEYCGLCHSDLSVINNEWGLSQYPVIPGHEAVGRIVAVGERVKERQVGQKVGVGWNAESDMQCAHCINGEHNFCTNLTPTIIGHQGGFADKIRAHWVWVVPLPDALDMSSAGPLLCAGATVFSPLVNFGVKPTDHVGVVGIGGLGHLAIKFANAWGCEVTAFTSSASKTEEAHRFGAHHVVSSCDSNKMLETADTLDYLLITVNIPLDWAALVKTLKPKGRMNVVGAVLEPMPISAIDLIFGQKSVSGSLNASPAITSAMLDFAARHQITPQVEHFPMSQVNDALEHLASGKARYRVVLDQDFT